MIKSRRLCSSRLLTNSPRSLSSQDWRPCRRVVAFRRPGKTYESNARLPNAIFLHRKWDESRRRQFNSLTRAWNQSPFGFEMHLHATPVICMQHRHNVVIVCDFDIACYSAERGAANVQHFQGCDRMPARRTLLPARWYRQLREAFKLVIADINAFTVYIIEVVGFALEVGNDTARPARLFHLMCESVADGLGRADSTSPSTDSP